LTIQKIPSLFWIFITRPNLQKIKDPHYAGLEWLKEVFGVLVIAYKMVSCNMGAGRCHIGCGDIWHVGIGMYGVSRTNLYWVLNLDFEMLSILL